MVVDLVVVLRFADEELCHRPEHLRFDGVAVLGGQRVTDRVVALDGVDQPYRIVEHLPEHAPGDLPTAFRVRAQRRVELGILQQHVARIVHVGPVAGQPVQRARRQQRLVVALVLFMGAPAALVLGYRHVDTGLHHLLQRCLGACLLLGKPRVAAFAGHLLPSCGSDQHRRGFGLSHGSSGAANSDALGSRAKGRPKPRKRTAAATSSINSIAGA